MVDLFDGLRLALSAGVLIYMTLGVLIGLIVGILPGLGGPVTLAVMIPFTLGLPSAEAFAFLLGMLAVTSVTGDLTSILLGVPGEAISAALVLDGHAMAKKGQASRAMGAVLSSSLMGALVGVAVLAVAIPFIRELVLLLGSPEMFMLTLAGLTFIAVLSEGSALKGLIAAALGLLLATVGLDPQTATPRYTFGQLELWDGIGIVAVATAIFSFPEILDMSVRGSIGGGADTRNGRPYRDALRGARESLIYRWLIVRCSMIGAGIGALPGLGGVVSQWVSYAHAAQSSKPGEPFGSGRIEGVVGPGAANNAKEGGGLIPTIAFGIPGSLSYAILLGAFILHGLVPGREMLTTHIDLTFSFVWIIAIANLVAVVVCFPLIKPMMGLTSVRADLVIPVLLVLVFLGSYLELRSMASIVTLLIFGALGIVMSELGWPRPPLLLGFILGALSESYLSRSMVRYGYEWTERPIVVFLGLLVILAVAMSTLKSSKRARVQ